MASPTQFNSGPLVLDSPVDKVNYSFTATVAANALTFALKNKAATDPTNQNAVNLNFRSSTATTGTYVTRSVAAALSVVVPASTTLGMTSAVPGYVYLYAIDNAGTVELAVSLSNSIDEATLQTTVAISGGASATVLYSTTARSNVAVRLLGRILISEAVAGTWATAPTEVSVTPFRTGKLFVAGTKVVLLGSVTSAAYAEPTTNTVRVTFIPQRTGLHKAFGNFKISTAGAAGQETGVSIQSVSGGTPTFVRIQDCTFTNAAANYTVTLSPFVIMDVVAGTSYTLGVYIKSTSGAASLNSASLADGHTLYVEEL